MARCTVTMDSRGRIQLPKDLRETIRWNDQQWYVVEDTEDGIVIKIVEPPEPVEAIRRVFSERLQPLGQRRGEAHNQYVSRWRHSSGAVIVSENNQPNIWVTRSTAHWVREGALPGVVQAFEPGIGKPGFRSNVSSTHGLKGEVVVKFRADGAAEARSLAAAMVYQLESAE